jgi:PKD repeat protein
MKPPLCMKMKMALGCGGGVAPVVVPFSFDIDTENIGISNNDQYRLPLFPGLTYNCTIDWGDGTQTTQTTDVSPTHTYATAGVYTIEITGTFPAIYNNNVDDELKIVGINTWGDIAWETMEGAFFGCLNIADGGYPSDVPDLSNCTSLESMLRTSGWNGPINDWDVSNITFMKSMLRNTPFNQPLDNWDMSNVTSVNEMLRSTDFDQDISAWSVPNCGVFTNFMNSTTWSTTNYGLFLVSLAGQSVQSGVTFGANSTQYPASAAAARQSLIDDDGWTFVDLGVAP